MQLEKFSPQPIPFPNGLDPFGSDSDLTVPESFGFFSPGFTWQAEWTDSDYDKLITAFRWFATVETGTTEYGTWARALNVSAN